MITSEHEASRAVDTWLEKNGGSFRYERLSFKRDSRGWVVVLAVFAREGYEIDGPLVLVVDPVTGVVGTGYP
jgi:hypothetical protein